MNAHDSALNSTADKYLFLKFLYLFITDKHPLHATLECSFCLNQFGGIHICPETKANKKKRKKEEKNS